MLFFALANCPFCSLSIARLWIEREHAVAFAPADPIADGHIVVAPRKHVSTIRAFPSVMFQRGGRRQHHQGAAGILEVPRLSFSCFFPRCDILETPILANMLPKTN